MHPSLVLLFLHLWGNVGLSLSQTALQCPVIHINDTIQVTGDPEEATYGNVLRFSCKSRTEILYGPAEIYCDANGMWSDNPPRCEAVKCKVPEIEHGTVTGDITDYNEHEILYFECNARYGKSEERPSRCIKMGQRADWSPTPACEQIKCKLQVSQLEGTRYDPPHRNVFSPGETLRVTCEARYWIFNPREISTVITCRDDGQWTSDPTCKEVTCSRPNDQHISYWDNYWQRKKTLGDTVRYSCTSGYKSTNGATRATCTRDGWTPDPLCQAQQCPVIHINDNIQVTGDPEEATYGNVLRFSCKSSTEILHGPAEIYCDENGMWSDNPPRCEAVKCKVPEIEHAIKCRLEVSQLEGTRYDPPHRNVFSPGETLRVTCEARYWIFNPREISTVVTCRDDGQWTSDPTCKEVTCSRPNDQHISYWDNYWQRKKTLGDTVRYSCTSGYKSTNGATRATCTREGWTPDPLCQGYLEVLDSPECCHSQLQLKC
ncbi:P-selectin-like [Channa argus]|uniref:P-selectin-like n=1 Tax=Channa argus TaxID=215402 RepID=UPI003521A2A6